MFSEKPDTTKSPQFQLYFRYNLDMIRERLKSDSGIQPGGRLLNELDVPHEALESAAPRLFLLLPSALELWNDSDPSTHSFRLYFLCDCQHDSIEDDYPTHVHISNHPGYALDRPLEFIRQFGRLSIVILEAVKYGYLGPNCCIPKLNTLQILHCLRGNDKFTLHQLTPATVGPLVDKAITYIHYQMFLELKQQDNHYLRSFAKVLASLFQAKQSQESHSISVSSFLQLQNKDNGLGGLNRVLFYSEARWLCQSHAFEISNTEELEKFVQSRGGTIDLQLATITISVDSLSQVNTFAATLDHGGHFFDISLKFSWSPSRSELQSALQHLSKCRANVLQIDGATFSSQQRPQEYSRDPFVRHLGVNGQSSGQLITLKNYPKPLEAYIYFGRHTVVIGFLFEGAMNHLSVDWVELGSRVNTFESIFQSALTSDEKELDATWIKLSLILKPLFAQGLKGVDLFEQQTKLLQCRLGTKDGAITGITELYLSSHSKFPMRELPFLKRLVIEPDAEGIFELLYKVMANNPKLEFVDIPTRELQVFDVVAIFFRTWPGTQTVQVTLYEHDSGRDGALLVKLLISRKRSNKGSYVAIAFLEWHYDHVSEALGDRDARVLDVATQSLNDSLVSLLLNTSLLSDYGLERMKRVLRQSDLESLSVDCGTFDPSLTSHLGQVLEAVNWSALRSLELSGDNVDGWIDLWAKFASITNLAPFELQLLRLIIIDSGGQRQRLSHSSVLWIHNLIYLFSPVEVQLKNIKLLEAEDWELIRGAVDDPSSLRLSLINCNNAHSV